VGYGWQDRAQRVHAAVRQTHGDAVTYTHRGGAASAPTVVFRAAYEQALVMGDGVPVTATRPGAIVHRADLSAPPLPGDRLTRLGTVYEVDDVHEQGPGVVLLWLREVA